MAILNTKDMLLSRSSSMLPGTSCWVLHDCVTWPSAHALAAPRFAPILPASRSSVLAVFYCAATAGWCCAMRCAWELGSKPTGRRKSMMCGSGLHQGESTTVTVSTLMSHMTGRSLASFPCAAQGQSNSCRFCVPGAPDCTQSTCWSAVCGWGTPPPPFRRRNQA